MPLKYRSRQFYHLLLHFSKKYFVQEFCGTLSADQPYAAFSARASARARFTSLMSPMTMTIEPSCKT